MADGWLTGAIMQVERFHAEGKHGQARGTQSAIDRAIEEGRFTEDELLEAGRAAARHLGRSGSGKRR